MRVKFLRENGARPEVAVIVPLYNYENYIGECLDSVAAQTFAPLELVVCEDRSTDDGERVALAWLEKHAERFARCALIQNDENRGLSATRNAGVAYADSPYVFMLDADNVIYPRCLSVMHEVLAESDAAFAYSLIEIFDERTPEFHDLAGAVDWRPDLLHQGNVIDAMVLHRKKSLADVGLFTVDDFFGRIGWEDFEVWFKYARAGLRGARVHQVLAKYRVHMQSMLRTRTNKKDNQIRLWLELEKRYPEFFKGKLSARHTIV